ncbi:hypothetical protein TMRH483_00976 [Qipengyuania sp. 483]
MTRRGDCAFPIPLGRRCSLLVITRTDSLPVESLCDFVPNVALTTLGTFAAVPFGAPSGSPVATVGGMIAPRTAARIDTEAYRA